VRELQERVDKSVPAGKGTRWRIAKITSAHPHHHLMGEP
jgi:hypothetical protein